MSHAELIPNTIDLRSLSIDELKALAAEAQKQAEALEKEQRQEAFKQLDELASQLGLTRADLTARYGPKRSGNALPPKYRNPQKPAQTWSGRGRKPAWVVKHIDRGGELEELKIA